MCRENAALLELPRSESQTVLRHLHCSVRLTQVELSVNLVTVHSCHKASRIGDGHQAEQAQKGGRKNEVNGNHSRRY